MRKIKYRFKATYKYINQILKIRKKKKKEKKINYCLKEFFDAQHVPMACSRKNGHGGQCGERIVRRYMEDLDIVGDTRYLKVYPGVYDIRHRRHD